MSLQEQQNLECQIREINSSLRLCDKLFDCTSIEDFLSLLYKETARRFKIKSLIFHWPSWHFGPLQYIYQSQGTYKNSVHYSMENKQQEIRAKDKTDSEYLAHCLGRPVHNVLSIPICATQYGVDNFICIFVEFCARNPEKLISFYQSLGVLINRCLDRLLMQDHLKTGQELWTATFNSLKEPLAVFDEQNVSNSNSIFNIIFEKEKFSLEQQILHWKGRVFEKNSYPVQIKGRKYTVYHYVDISESLVLRNQMIQNIKMSALGELGEAIAHKLSNPLTGVLSMAQLLLSSRKLDEEIKKDMEGIIEAVSRSLNIISNLLDFSQSESPLHVHDLNQVVKKTLPFLKSVIRFSDFHVDFCKTPVFVKVQAGLLQQVVFNLVKNACQAVSELEDSQIKVRVYKTGKQALLYVEDNGKGVSPADYENVFKPFFTTKSKNGGTGIGLNISQSIVKGFEGTLTAGRSSLGGACFTMSLPLECTPIEQL